MGAEVSHANRAAKFVFRSTRRIPGCNQLWLRRNWAHYRITSLGAYISMGRPTFVLAAFLSALSLMAVGVSAKDKKKDPEEIGTRDVGKGVNLVYAAGIRNPVGLGVNPVTGEVWCSVNERDALGDNLVPDYITHVEPGGFYGWPWYYIGGHQGVAPPTRSGSRMTPTPVGWDPSPLGQT
jgi:glucose/arabinose dehydrogenase